MGLTRRKFLTATGVAAVGAVVFNGCGVPEQKLEVQSPVNLPEDLVTGGEDWYATLCRECSSPEGVLVRVVEGRAKKVEGNPDYPINQGKHSARCEAGLQALYNPDRILGPMERVGDQLVPIDWETAINKLVEQLRSNQGAPGSVLLVTELVNAHPALLMKRFISSYGAQHLTYEPLGETVFRDAVKGVFGQDWLPDFDIKNANYLLSFGADFLGTWVSPVRYAGGYGEFRQGEGRAKRGTFVQVEPRFSMTAASADQWLPIRPGTEGLLALSIAYVIISDREKSGQPIGNAAQQITAGAGSKALERYSPGNVHEETGVSAEHIEEIARAFAQNQPSLAIGGGSAAAHTNGLFNLTWIYALNLLVDNVGKDGGIKFNPEPPLEEMRTPPQVSSLSEWQDAAGRLDRGDIKLVLAHNANPVYSMPSSLNFQEALGKAFIVSFSSFMDETTAQADLILPDHVYLEAWGSDIPNPGPGYQTIGFQQPVVRPYIVSTQKGIGSRSFFDLLLDVAKRLGGTVAKELPEKDFLEFLQKEAQKLHAANTPTSSANLTDDFRAFWNEVLQRGGWWDTQKKASPTAIKAPQAPHEAPKPSFSSNSADYPFYLVPFASQSLTDGRGANLPWLQSTPDPLTTVTWKTWVELNPKTAKEIGVKGGDIVRVTTSEGKSLEAPVYIYPAAPPDVISIPFGLGHTSFGSYAQGRGANVFAILAPLATDGEKKALAWAATKVKVEPTGKRSTLPKFEGTEPGIQLEDKPLIQIVPS